MMKTTNRGRNKFFSCFKPVLVDDDSHSHQINPSAGGGGGKEITIIPNKPSDLDRKSKSSRRFKHLLKSLLFDNPLPKKLRSRKSNKDDDAYGSLQNYKFSDSKSSSFTDTSDSDDTLRINSTRSSSIFSASTNSSSLSSSSMSSSNSRSSSQRTGTGYFQDELPQNDIYCSTIILSLFLLCLLVLVCWGKVCAIFCTSTCFFLCSRRSNDLKSAAEYVESAVDTNSKEYKKKMIMVGLLGRERSRLL